MVYYTVKLTVGKEEGFVNLNKGLLVTSWCESVFFTDFNKAKNYMYTAAYKAQKTFPRRQVSAIIMADDIEPNKTAEVIE